MIPYDIANFLKSCAHFHRRILFLMKKLTLQTVKQGNTEQKRISQIPAPDVKFLRKRLEHRAMSEYPREYVRTPFNNFPLIKLRTAVRNWFYLTCGEEGIVRKKTIENTPTF